MTNYIVHYYNIDYSDYEYAERIQGITENYVWAFDKWQLRKTTNITKTLHGLKDAEWVVFNALGHGIDQPDFYAKAIEECQRQNSPMMAHILNYNDSLYPELDQQCLIVNRKTWLEIGAPAFEATADTITVKQLNISTDNAHDDYTPMWVAPGSGTPINLTTTPFGTQAIARFTNAGYKVINFTPDLRYYKWFLYPKDNKPLLKEFFATGNYNTDPLPDIIKRIVEEKRSLSDTVYLLNSESVHDYKEHTGKDIGVLDHYIGVAAGFKGVLLLKVNGFTDTTTITYVDVSQAGLQFQQYLLDNWNGDLGNYKQVTDNFQALHPEYRYAWRSWNSWDSEVQSFLDQSQVTKQEFKELWEKTSKLKHNFVCADFLDMDITAHINYENKNVYVWLSNVFDMQWTSFMIGRKHAHRRKDVMLKSLSSSNNNIVIEYSGQYTVYNSVA